MRKIKCCADCPDRHVGCHGDCEKYKVEREAFDAEKDEIRKRKEELSRADSIDHAGRRRRATTEGKTAALKSKNVRG